MNGMLNCRRIRAEDDAALARIIRFNLEKFGLNIPGTAYFDPELDHLSDFYNNEPSGRAYYVALDDAGRIVGGAGFAEFADESDCAELQKLYLDDTVKGKGYGKELMKTAEVGAKAAGYKKMYLETHTNLSVALGMYEKAGYRQIEMPIAAKHSTMNRFYIKEL